MGKEQNSEKLTREALVSEIRSKAERLFPPGGVRHARFELPRSTIEEWENRYIADSQIKKPRGPYYYTQVLLFEWKRRSDKFWDSFTGKRRKELTIHLNFSGTEKCFLDLHEGEKPRLERYSEKSVEASIKTLEAFSGLLDLVPQELQK